MKHFLTTTIAALVGTTLLPATAIGFEEVNTDPAANIDDETTVSNDEDPFTDAGAEVDADTTNPDNPEITDVSTVNPQITDATDDLDTRTKLASPSEFDADSPDSTEDMDNPLVDAPAAVAMPNQNDAENVEDVEDVEANFDSTNSDIPEVSELEDDDG